MKQSQTKKKQKKLKVRCKLNYKHYNNDVSNCTVECVTKFLNSEERKYYNPYPITLGSVYLDGTKSDPLLTLVQKKREYQFKMETVKYMYHKYQKKLQLSKQFKSFQDMQDILLQDPDKYFCSNYNWYYTNGNLVIKKIESSDFMFHTTNNSELCVTKLKKKKSGWIAKNKRILNNHNSDIYQLDSVSSELRTLVGVRQKNDILLYDVRTNDNRDEDITCKLVNSHNTDVPFVTMCLSFNQKEYTAINANQMLQIWDLGTGKSLYERHIPHNLESLEGDCFAQVSYHDNNSLAYVNRTHFYIFDKRSNNFQSQNINLSEIDDRLANIRQMNSLTYYISTFRDILLFDVRSQNIVNKYSHSFHSAPYISDYIFQNGNNIFCVSSCKPNEKLILEQENDLYYIPASLPTIIDSFESSLLRSSTMNMSLSIRERLDASTTGMQLWYNADHKSYTLFFTNVLGDIYCQEVNKNAVDINSEQKAYKYFQKWNNTLIDNRSSINDTNQLHFVDKVGMHHIPFTYSEPLDLPSIIKNKRLNDSIQDLKKRKKGFSEKICDLWNNVTEINDLDGIGEVPADVTVRNWLSHYCKQIQQDPNQSE